jgi:acyl-CoA dehydrogenase
MSINFSEEQSMLLETATDFCRNHSPIDVVRQKLDAETIDTGQWQEMADLGWLAINIPAEFGGLEMGLASVAPVMESMGRYLMGSPFFGCVLASEALIACGDQAQKADWLPRLATGCIASVALTEEDGNWHLDEIGALAKLSEDSLFLSGQKCFVTDADVAEFLIVSVNYEGTARLLLLLGDQIPAGALVRETVIDQTRRCFQVCLDGIAVSKDQLLPGVEFEAIENAALLLLCAEISGGLVGALHTIVEYLKTRKAFDRYIGSYQALKHPAADILLSLEAAKSHLYHAATLIALDKTDEIEKALRMAKAQGSEAFAFAGDRAVQFHGGFGFTFECDAQLYLRRALWCQYQFGDEAYHRQLLAPLLLDQVLLDQVLLDDVLLDEVN